MHAGDYTDDDSPADSGLGSFEVQDVIRTLKKAGRTPAPSDSDAVVPEVSTERKFIAPTKPPIFANMQSTLPKRPNFGKRTGASAFYNEIIGKKKHLTLESDAESVSSARSFRSQGSRRKKFGHNNNSKPTHPRQRPNYRHRFPDRQDHQQQRYPPYQEQPQGFFSVVYNPKTPAEAAEWYRISKLKPNQTFLGMNPPGTSRSSIPPWGTPFTSPYMYAIKPESSIQRKNAPTPKTTPFPPVPVAKDDDDDYIEILSTVEPPPSQEAIDAAAVNYKKRSGGGDDILEQGIWAAFNKNRRSGTGDYSIRGSTPLCESLQNMTVKSESEVIFLD